MSERSGRHDLRILGAVRPDRRRLLDWLVESAITGDGHVFSWTNPEHPGYLYPEAAGLLLALLAQEIDGGPPVMGPRAQMQRRQCLRIFAALCDDIDDQGALGRGGIGYLFDSGIVLHAFLRLRERLCERSDDGDRIRVEAAIEKVYKSVLWAILNRRPTSAEPPAAPRWSESWGCHLLKLALPLSAYARAYGDTRPVAAIRRLLSDMMPLADGGRFVVHRGSRRTYVHACCYAAEGLLAIDPSIDPRARASAVATATWLATIQRRDGAMPAWHDGIRGEGPYPSDIVAQCVRLWVAIDRRRFATEIVRGLTRLAALQSPAGGLFYSDRSQDINTWATIFAVQAVAWA
ncbi:MAG TPA: hypothetical protein ENJ18_05330, partial [Nannocystis exedens]|nr:hypothetical protein [Nannocystis exedens]